MADIDFSERANTRCRAQVHPDCAHGRFSINEDGWREDGTYLVADDSIVCDACYIAIGMPTNPVLPGATAGPR